MKKLIFSIFAILLPLCAYSQNPEGDSISPRRDRWLMNQRTFPTRNIPKFGYINAIRHRDRLRQTQGYFIRHGHDGPFGWTTLGPTPGHYSGYDISGRCSFVKYDSQYPNNVYLGSACGGLWKSIDYGNSWMPLTDDFKSLSSGAIAIDEVNNRIYYGTGEFKYFTYAYYGYYLYISTNGGLTFDQTAQGLPFPCYIAAIAIKPNERNVLLAAVGTNYANPINDAGLYRSEDYGLNWTRIVPGGQDQPGLVCTDVAFSPDGSKAYIAGPQNVSSQDPWENGVAYRVSYDGGQTFQLKNGSVFPEGRTRISVCKNDGSKIYVITCRRLFNCQQQQDYELWV